MVFGVGSLDDAECQNGQSILYKSNGIDPRALNESSGGIYL